MNREAFKLARATLRTAVKEYGWRRTWGKHRPQHLPLTARNRYSYGPGRFEGEHWSIVHFYEAFMNGGGDTFGEDWDAFELTPTEAEAFGMHAGRYAVLWHSDQGFVSLSEEDATFVETNSEEDEQP